MLHIPPFSLISCQSVKAVTHFTVSGVLISLFHSYFISSYHQYKVFFLTSPVCELTLCKFDLKKVTFHTIRQFTNNLLFTKVQQYSLNRLLQSGVNEKTKFRKRGRLHGQMKCGGISALCVYVLRQTSVEHLKFALCKHVKR